MNFDTIPAPPHPDCDDDLTVVDCADRDSFDIFDEADLPTVTLLRSDPIGVKRYRIEGGAISEEWAKSHAEHVARERLAGRVPETAAYCEVTVWFDGPNLGSYGGSVWPSAWPRLFEPHRGSAQSGPYTVITSTAKSLLLAADREADLAEPLAACTDCSRELPASALRDVRVLDRTELMCGRCAGEGVAS